MLSSSGGDGGEAVSPAQALELQWFIKQNPQKLGISRVESQQGWGWLQPAAKQRKHLLSSSSAAQT